MKKLGEEFMEFWDEFTDAVFGKIQSPLQCKDPVLIVMNSGLFKLTNEQFDILMILSVVHKAIEIDYGADAAISAVLTKERIDILNQITALIKAAG